MFGRPTPCDSRLFEPWFLPAFFTPAALSLLVFVRSGPWVFGSIELSLAGVVFTPAVVFQLLFGRPRGVSTLIVPSALVRAPLVLPGRWALTCGRPASWFSRRFEALWPSSSGVTVHSGCLVPAFVRPAPWSSNIFLSVAGVGFNPAPVFPIFFRPVPLASRLCDPRIPQRCPPRLQCTEVVRQWFPWDSRPVRWRGSSSLVH